MHDVLNSLGKNLQEFLEGVLPKCNSQWWERCVVDNLTFQQKRFLEERKISSIAELDLAGLLRIFDQNWREIKEFHPLPYEARNWLKETQSIRNRWAHLPPGGLNQEDLYRDLDTVFRLMTVIGADDSVLADVKQARENILQCFNSDNEHAVKSSNAHVSSGIVKGDVIRLITRPDQKGAVIDVLEDGEETRYSVFHNDSISTYYASQVEIVNPTFTERKVGSDCLHATLTALQLRHPSTSHLYSLFASRINFVPYQFRPVLKLIQGDRPRMLIADEVGVGKTIEAGLVLKELQARREIRSVLVICPKSLVAEEKWLKEMKRFDEQFVHIDGNALRYCLEETHLDGVWPQQYARAILPYSLFDEGLLMGKETGRRQRGLLDLDPPPCFDLVIVDEAHHIRNTDTWAYRTVRYFCDNAEAVVLLSATPIQLGDNDLFNLLHLLRPDFLPSRQDFDSMAEPNPFLNEAIEAARIARPEWRDQARNCIESAVATPWGRGVLVTDPRIQRAYDLLDEEESDVESRLTLVRQLEELYTFSPLINRTRRRDIGNFTTRKPDTVAVEFTPEQADLYGDLIDLVSRILAYRHGDENLNFMLSTLRRQVASCVFGLAPLLESILQRHLSKIEMSEMGDENVPDDVSEILDGFQDEVEALISKARSLSGLDPKFDAFLRVIRDKQKLPNNKLLVFSTFRHTLAYLIERLRGESVRIGLIHGNIPDEERRDLRNRFSLSREEPRALDVLLSSEVGCEGLDYQFCDGLVNYDIPWNPMRVEQRIGRIDRYGQKSEAVMIYNFITPGTVDAEIYERCLLRIGVFRQALGGSEEILGRLTKDICNIAENFNLTPDEQAARLQQLADNEIRMVQEQARLEEEQAKLFGLTPPQHDEDMIKQASSFWLAPPMLANLIGQYLEGVQPSKTQKSLKFTGVTSLRVGQSARDKLLIDFRELAQTGSVAINWERWLKGSESNLTITFDPVVADEMREIVFITPSHPLARQAARSMEPGATLMCNLSIQSKEVPSGRYPYAVYQWRKHGLKEDFTFQPICTEPTIGSQILPLLESAHDLERATSITADEKQSLEKSHHQFWSRARAEHIEEISETARSRINSLETTHGARVSLLEEQLDAATDERIRRMRQSQIEAAVGDFNRRLDELNRVAEQGDIIAEMVAMGILTVER